MGFVTTSSKDDRPATFGGLTVVHDVDAGAWVDAGVDGSRTVHGLVPRDFDAYAVIFHPAYREVRPGEEPSLFAPFELARDQSGAHTRIVYHREVKWAEVAAANRNVAHATMEWAAITGLWTYRWNGDQPGLWDMGPQHGSLPLRPTTELCRLLAQHTSTPAACFFGTSIIYGDLPERIEKEAAHALDARVLEGPLLFLPSNPLSDHEPTGHRSPNLWWPKDRAWFVHSNYDLQETYLGGSAQCVDALLASAELEAMRIDPGVPLVDEINPEPGGEYQG